MGLDTYLRFLIALLFVLGLIGALAWAVRRFGLRGMGAMVTGGGRGRRLAVVEMATLDPRRRLVLVRRDGVEHLLLLGASADLVIETGVTAPAPHAPAPHAPAPHAPVPPVAGPPVAGPRESAA